MTTVLLTVGAVSVAGVALETVQMVLVPLPASDTQKGLDADSEIPHAPTTLESVTAAVPDVSAIRLV